MIKKLNFILLINKDMMKRFSLISLIVVLILLLFSSCKPVTNVSKLFRVKNIKNLGKLKHASKAKAMYSLNELRALEAIKNVRSSNIPYSFRYLDDFKTKSVSIDDASFFIFKSEDDISVVSNFERNIDRTRINGLQTNSNSVDIFKSSNKDVKSLIHDYAIYKNKNIASLERIKLYVDGDALTLMNNSNFEQLYKMNTKIVFEGDPYNILKIRISHQNKYFIDIGQQGNLYVELKNINRVSNYSLKSKSLFRSDIKVVDLTNDPMTRSFISRNMQVNSFSFDLQNEAELLNALKSSSDKLMILLGHIENGKFVTYSSNGEVLLKVDLQNLIEFSKKRNLSIFPIGCKSAFHNKFSIGTLEDLNSIEVLRDLNNAIDNSPDVHAFFNNLASEKLKLIIDGTSIDNYKGISFTTLQKLKRGQRRVEAAYNLKSTLHLTTNRKSKWKDYNLFDMLFETSLLLIPFIYIPVCLGKMIYLSKLNLNITMTDLLPFMTVIKSLDTIPHKKVDRFKVAVSFLFPRSSYKLISQIHKDRNNFFIYVLIFVPGLYWIYLTLTA